MPVPAQILHNSGRRSKAGAGLSPARLWQGFGRLPGKGTGNEI